MFDKWLHRGEASAKSITSNSAEQQDEPAAAQKSFTAAGPTPPSRGATSAQKQSLPASRQPSQLLQRHASTHEDEEADSAADEEEEEENCVVAAKPHAKPALLQDKTAAEYLDDDGAAGPTSAPSTTSIHSSVARQPRPAAAVASTAVPAAAPKPWKVARQQPTKQPLVPAISQPQPQHPQQQQQLQQQHESPQHANKVDELQKQLQLEAKAREELEDMLLRYERQLKAEMQARQAAEAAAAEALSMAATPTSQQHPDWQHQQDQLQQDRAALESMRADFEAQLHTARSELAKAQSAMSSNEAQVRAEAAAACERLSAEYESRLALMSSELDRTRQELAVRTHALAAELTRWKRQAATAASAVLEAKDEVLQRKRELDSTKDKMDVLLDKLYTGKEANNNLSGAIAAAAGSYQQAFPGQYGLGDEDSYTHPAARASRKHEPPAKPRNPAIQRQQPQQPHSRAQQPHAHAQSHTAGALTRTHPTQQRHVQQGGGPGPQGFFLPPAGAHMGGPLVGYPSMLPWSPWGANFAGAMPPIMSPSMSTPGGMMGGWQQQLQQQQHVMPLQQQQMGAPMPQSQGRQAGMAAGHTLPSIARPQPQQKQLVGQYGPPGGSTSHAAPGVRSVKDKGGSYTQQLKASQHAVGASAPAAAGAPSRLPRYAAATQSSGSVPQGKASSSSRKAQAPDRFKESSKNAAMITAMANRW